MFNLDDFKLDYDKSALEPYMSKKTLDFHHGKHLAAYIQNLNDLAAGTKFAKMALLDIVRETAGNADTAKLFNNAAQVANHDFFFKCLAKDSSAEFPPAIASAFGSRTAFNSAFKEAATAVFGSGWVWLVSTSAGKFEIVQTANADTPFARGAKPLLTLDVWEHAYYLDYQNRRADFVDAFLGHLVNWGFVGEQI